MRIPREKLSPATLRAVVQEFVTRDGTDHTSVERRIESVLRQLEAGRVELHFDSQTETCNIVTVEDGKNPSTDDVHGRWPAAPMGGHWEDLSDANGGRQS